MALGKFPCRRGVSQLTRGGRHFVPEVLRALPEPPPRSEGRAVVLLQQPETRVHRLHPLPPIGPASTTRPLGP
eukprot:Skav229199  [mRNA]  locus=scaffold1004:509743:514030:+ [translate_table: standard]